MMQTNSIAALGLKVSADRPGKDAATLLAAQGAAFSEVVASFSMPTPSARVEIGSVLEKATDRRTLPTLPEDRLAVAANGMSDEHAVSIVQGPAPEESQESGIDPNVSHGPFEFAPHLENVNAGILTNGVVGPHQRISSSVDSSPTIPGGVRQDLSASDVAVASGFVPGTSFVLPTATSAAALQSVADDADIAILADTRPNRMAADQSKPELPSVPQREVGLLTPVSGPARTEGSVSELLDQVTSEDVTDPAVGQRAGSKDAMSAATPISVNPLIEGPGVSDQPRTIAGIGATPEPAVLQTSIAVSDQSAKDLLALGAKWEVYQPRRLQSQSGDLTRRDLPAMPLGMTVGAPAVSGEQDSRVHGQGVETKGHQRRTMPAANMQGGAPWGDRSVGPSPFSHSAESALGLEIFTGPIATERAEGAERRLQTFPSKMSATTSVVHFAPSQSTALVMPEGELMNEPVQPQTPAASIASESASQVHPTAPTDKVHHATVQLIAPPVISLSTFDAAIPVPGNHVTGSPVSGPVPAGQAPAQTERQPVVRETSTIAPSQADPARRIDMVDHVTPAGADRVEIVSGGWFDGKAGAVETGKPLSEFAWLDRSDGAAADSVSEASKTEHLRETARILTDPKTPRQIAEQIVSALRHGGGDHVELTLNPEELGRVRMTLHASDTSLAVSLTVERNETADLMRRHLASLDAEFRELGYSDVTFSFAGSGAGTDAGDRKQASETTDSGEGASAQIDEAILPRKGAAVPAGGLDLRI